MSLWIITLSQFSQQKSRVGLLLERYKSGPLPKVFKVIPQLPAWAQILSLTRPEKWTPQATRAAVRLFISNMKPQQARVFLEGVLLDAIRDDIRQHGKLNIHYYEALVKALYKPAAFFKGIIFPLLDVSFLYWINDMSQSFVDWLYSQRSSYHCFRVG